MKNHEGKLLTQTKHTVGQNLCDFKQLGNGKTY